jgi:hypothetical protein
MDSQIVAVFCFCDDLLKTLYHYEDRQCQISDAEVMTAAIIAMLYFRGNYEVARRFLHDHGYVPNVLSKSPSIVACIGFPSCSWPCLACWVRPGKR